MDWDAFTDWLESDPAHRAAYDAIALDDRWVEANRDDVIQKLQATDAETPEAVVDIHRHRVWRWLGVGGAFAAAAALALMLVPARQQAGAPWQSYAASPNATRTLALSGGVNIVLSRNSRLEVSSTDRQAMRLIGSAYFDVAHQPDRRLTIQAGKYVISDIGTRFEISMSEKALRVSVAEGSLSLSHPKLASPVQLSAGQGVIGYRADGTLRSITIAKSTVGSFRRGVLTYQDVPVDVVASELSSYVGAPIRVDPAVGARRFSGALPVGNGKALADNLAQLMDLKSSERNGTIYLSAADRP